MSWERMGYVYAFARGLTENTVEMDFLVDQIQIYPTEIVGFFSAAEQGTMEGMSCQTHNYSTSVLAIG